MTGLLLLVPLALVSSAPFGTMRNNAEVVRNLGRFLEQYIGDCDSDDPSFDKNACEKEAARIRKEQQGKLFRLDLDDASEQVHFAAWDAKKGAFRLHMVPFFGERALGMSVGKPKRVDDGGRPVLDNVPIWVKPPPGQPELIFRRELERGMVRLELIWKAKGVYRMKRKGDTDIKGMEVELVGLRLYPGHGDEPLAEQTY